MFRRLSSGKNPNGEYEHRPGTPRARRSSLDTSKAELSMGPGNAWRNPGRALGKSYTAHADFMNGWTEDGAQFMTRDSGMNQDWIAALRFLRLQ